MELLIIGVVTALNIIIIMVKYKADRILDATLDLSLLIAIAIVFGGSFAGLVVGTITSLIISAYLYFSPPKMISTKVDPKEKPKSALATLLYVP